ncbi:MAG: hypothetical protein H5T68_01285 [Chloroflexi bacterium]|nr:hypothetical protein [Chloroflexota bacterium]
MRRLLLVLVIMLAMALGVRAAWQQTKTSYAVGVITSPSGDGTFRVLPAYCGAVRPGDSAFCAVFVENLSDSTIHVDDYWVVSQRPDVIVDSVEMWNRDIPYNGKESLNIHFHVLPTATPGGFVLEVTVTCLGR